MSQQPYCLIVARTANLHLRGSLTSLDLERWSG
jgi:hypothetical protein